MSVERSAATRFFLHALLFECGLGLAALAAGWALALEPLARISWTAEGFGQGALATLPLAVLLLLLVRVPWEPIVSLKRFLDEFVVPLFRGMRLWQLAVISIAAGVCEELLFRGVMQVGIDRWLGPPHGTWVAIWITALIFALAHALSPTYALAAGLISIYFGWVLVLTGNLLVPITAHALYDFAALVYLLRTSKPQP